MGVPREDDQGGSDSYESFAGTDVNVDINDMGAYYKEMLDVQLDAMGPADHEVAALAELIRESFLNAEGEVGAFPEGVVMAQMMQARQSDFTHFMHDALNGVRNVGAAAIVVAEAYNDTDFDSSASLGDVAFAFADPNAKPPSGFRKQVESFSEAEQRLREQTGQYAMAMSGDDSLATVYSPYGGIMVYNFSDGSSKQVVTVPYSDGRTRTDTTIYGPGGTVLQSTTEETSGQTRTTSTTSYNGEQGSGTRATTKTSTAHDGTVTVTSQTATVDKDGKTTHADPAHTTTIQPGTHSAGDGEQGPVEKAENDLGTSGTNDYIRRHGVGY